MSKIKDDYEITKCLLEYLIAETQGRLSPEELRAVQEYLDHGECGLAFEHLCDALRGAAAEISAQEYGLIEKLGIHMQIDSEEWLGLPHGRTWHVREFRQRPSAG